MPQSFFNKVACQRPATLSKRDSGADVFTCQFCEISKSTFSYRKTPVVASENISS